MSSDMSNIVGRIKDTWRNGSPALRWASVGLTATLVVAMSATWWFNRPKWVALVQQADPKEAAAIVAKLNELKVPNQPTGDGYTITVQEKDLYTARLALAQADLGQGKSGGTGFEWFATPQFGATEFDRKVNYLQAQQTELSRALMRMGSIEFADVKLAIPEQTVFTRDQHPVTAAVLVRPKSGQTIPANQVLGIVNFVAKSIQGLTPDNVTVVDDKGRLLSNGAADALMSGGGAEEDASTAKAQEEMRTKYERNVQGLLEPLFGPGNVVTKVHLELDLSTSKTQSVTYGPNVMNKQQSTVETGKSTNKTGTNNATTADPNRPTNPGSPPTYQAETPKDGSSDTYKNQTNSEWKVSEETKTIYNPSGAVKHITVGVVVNREDLTPDQVSMIKSTVASATGALSGDISVTSMKFNQDISTNMKTTQATQSANSRANMLALGLGGLAVLFLIGFLWSRRGNRDEEEVELAFDQPINAGELMAQALGSKLDVKLDDLTLNKPDLSMGEENQQPFDADVTSLIPQETKLDTGSMVDREIERMIKDEPGSVAAMLSNWLKS